VVLTMVTRDDLDDGGAAHVAATIRAIRVGVPQVTVEVLTSDFAGRFPSAELLLNEHAEIFAHNIETVRSLSVRIRSKATYDGSLRLLSQIKEVNPSQVTKSSLMVGLGETQKEVLEALQDLSRVGVSMVTIGQYLQPTSKQIKVQEWIHPDLFRTYEEAARGLGIPDVVAGPFVRSSYRSHPLKKERL
jgi:lipoyl synthase